MDTFKLSQVFLKDIAFIIGELAAVGLLFIGLYMIIKIFFKKIDRVSFLSNYKEQSTVILKKIKGFLTFLCFLLLFALIGYNGYLIYKGTGVYENALDLVSKIPNEFWKQLLLGILKIILISITAYYFIRLAFKVLDRTEVRAKKYKNLRSNDEVIGSFFSRLRNTLKNSIKLLVLIYAMDTLFFPEVFLTYTYLILKIYLIVSGGILLNRGATVVVDSLEDLSKKYWYREGYLDWYNRLNNLLPLFRRCLEYIIYVWITSLVMLQITFFAKYVTLVTAIAKIIGIFFIARVAVEFLKISVDKYMMRSENTSLNQQRQTLIPITKSILKAIVYFVAFMLTLRALNLNPLPILAGAGIFGLVIGMGAQPLINDVVAGIFILFESIFLVGDYIETDSGRGIVEAIFLRTTKIRDPDGQLHILRNGQINGVKNYSKGYTFAVVEVGVDYDSDLPHVFRVLEDVGRIIKEKNSSVLEELVVQGIKDFGESEILIRTTTKVKPGHHFRVSFEIRGLIKDRFDLEGIEIPFARRVLIFKDQNEPRKGSEVFEKEDPADTEIQ